MIAGGANDSYLGFERRLKATVQCAQSFAFGPLLALLEQLDVSPNVISALQIALGLALLYTVPRWPRWSLLIWLLALLCDSLDGSLARRLGRTSAFGALWDQTCDHIREILVIAALAHCGAAAPLWTTLYALAYPAFNLFLLLANRHGVPLHLALKSYLLFYPALIAYLGWDLNYLTPTLALATLAMALGSGIILKRLRQVI